jgi:hypothetical protein
MIKRSTWSQHRNLVPDLEAQGTGQLVSISSGLLSRGRYWPRAMANRANKYLAHPLRTAGTCSDDGWSATLTVQHSKPFQARARNSRSTLSDLMHHVPSILGSTLNVLRPWPSR